MSILTTVLGSGWFSHAAGGALHVLLEHDTIIGIYMEEQGLVGFGYGTYKQGETAKAPLIG